MSPEPDDAEPSYIDYEAFLAPAFRPAAFANTLVLATNNPSDLPLDLSTPLSRVLFDMQEIDSHIDQLTTRSALPLLRFTADQTAASTRIVGELDGQVRALNASYRRLEKEVVEKHAEADRVRLAASRLWETLRLGRAVGRCLQLARQLELQHGELYRSSSAPSTPSTPSSPPPSSPSASTVGPAPGSARKENHRALVRCTDTLLSLRELLSDTALPASEGRGLDRLAAIRSLQAHVIEPVERAVRETSEQLVREFAIGSAASFAQADDARARLVSAVTALYLLSPPPASAEQRRWHPALLVHALESYLRSAILLSSAALARGLAALPTLDRVLADVASRCQDIVALEAILAATKAPAHPLAPPPDKAAASGKHDLLQPLLAHLETGSLASYFWRTLAGTLAARVTEIVNRGGVSARTLRTNKTNVGDAIRDCVISASQLPSSVASGKSREGADGERGGSWEREVAVMVGSVLGALGR